MIYQMEETDMSDACKVITQPAQQVLSIRTHTSIQELPQTLGKAYGAIEQYLGEIGEIPGGAPFVAYYNMDMQNLDIEAGFPVLKQLVGRGEIQSSVIPGGEKATCIYTGPYNEIASAYEELSAWITRQGYRASGVAYEFYLNDPAETPPQELQTQILFPLAG